MVRSKKGEEKPKEPSTLSIDVESFVRMRDSVVTQLATLQEHCRTISSGYIKYTNAVLGEHDGGADGESGVLNNALLSGLGGLGAASPVVPVPLETKAQKKKRAHDPNAPKRPLTPYFLYMQTARPIIAEDLGPNVAKGAVSAEGVRRWNAMAVADKQLWTNAYTDNLRLYNARVHSYKAGSLNAKDMTDDEAAAYAEANNIGVNLEPTADGQLTSEAAMDPAAAIATIPDEDSDAPEPTTKSTPKTKASGSRPSKPSKPSKAPTPVVPPPSNSSTNAAIVPPVKEAEKEKEKEKSPDKKRKRTSKAAKEAEAEAAAAAVAAEKEKEKEAAETPKAAEKEKKPRKKKSKSDA